MKRSESIAKIAEALAKAQGAIKAAAKDSTNPHYNNRYADLASVWEACRAQLAANGIAVVQGPEADGAKVTVTTLLSHLSGEWMETSLTVTAQQGTPQGVGSAITYARRYGLAAMVGVAPDDDDGEAAEGREKKGAAAKAKPDPKASDAAASAVRAAATKTAEETKAAIRNPAFRKQEAIRELNGMGLDVRATLKDVLGRTFPEGQDIKLQNEDELEKLERQVVLLKAKHNGERHPAH